jgi:hypothetical protein
LYLQEKQFSKNEEDPGSGVISDTVQRCEREDAGGIRKVSKVLLRVVISHTRQCAHPFRGPVKPFRDRESQKFRMRSCFKRVSSNTSNPSAFKVKRSSPISYRSSGLRLEVMAQGRLLQDYPVSEPGVFPGKRANRNLPNYAILCLCMCFAWQLHGYAARLQVFHQEIKEIVV